LSASSVFSWASPFELAAASLAWLSRPAAGRGAVSRAGKAGAALAGALHDVQRGVGFFGAGEARHGGSCCHEQRQAPQHR